MEESGRDQITDIYESGVSGVCIMFSMSVIFEYSCPNKEYVFV